MSNALHIAAPAKLNLGLAILRKRADGFHDLLSVFHAVSWCDEITLTPASTDISLACNGGDAPEGPDNLVWRAANLVRTRFGTTSGVDIRLTKRIPSGAGLGGGSSDAAATVRGLAELWNIDARATDWIDLCAQLGSDVPFFWHGGTAVVTGRGEFVEPLPAQMPLTFVVAVPSVKVSTPWAYQQLRQPFPDHSEYERRVTALKHGRINLFDFCRELGNDFQNPVEKEYPEIQRLRQQLAECGAVASLMSGSGSAVFGLFENPERATDALGALHHIANGVVAGSHTPARVSMPPA